MPVSDKLSGRLTLRGRSLQWRHKPFHANDPLGTWDGFLKARSIPEEQTFFFPRLANLPNPEDMQDMAKAADRLSRAVTDGERIHIFGDFDCDGVCGAAILVDLLTQAGACVSASIPHRVHDGHGIDPANVEKVHAEGVSLAISVDTGISEDVAAKRALSLGLDLVISDHHLPGDHLPEAFAILNPARADCGFAGRLLCGTGVAFFLLMAVWRRLRESGRTMPDLKQALDRVAIATIADVMSLTGVNRVLVCHGLKQLNSRPSKGVASLLRKGRNNAQITAQNIGFQIAPRLNAAGRMDHGKQAMQLLCCQDPDAVGNLAAELDELNRQRQSVERKTLASVEERLKETDSNNMAAFDPDWHAGVVGLVAGRLSRKHGRPAAVGFVEPDGCIRVSLRGGRGFHVSKLLDSCSAHLIGYGGHAGAGGASMAVESWDDFVKAFSLAVQGQETSVSGAEPLYVDGILGTGAVHAGLIERLQWLQPFGQGNPEGLWCFESMKIAQRRDMRGGNIRLLLESGTSRLNVVIFRAADIESHLIPGSTHSFLGYLRFDEYRGGSQIQFIIEDVF